MNSQENGLSGPLEGCIHPGSPLWKTAFVLVLRLVLGGIFMHAGIMKIRDPAAFASSIASYQLLAPAVISLVAFQFPWFEILLGFLLIAGFPQRAPALGIMALSLLFVAVHGQAMLRGLSIDCGCFGSGYSTGPKVGLALSSLLFIAAGWLYSYDRTLSGAAISKQGTYNRM